MMLYLKRLENRTLAGLHLEELACLPQVEPAALVTDAVAGANVSLRCSVFGLPSASVSWWHSNRLVANGSELRHAWEDQYYSIGEYRTNDHQVQTIFIDNFKSPATFHVNKKVNKKVNIPVIAEDF